jgi:FixJ family two-component response regulator
LQLSDDGQLIVLLDDDGFRADLARRLRHDGYAVSELGAARDLDRLATLDSVRCLVTDYRVAGDDGLAVAERFHAAHPEVPVVMITSHRDAALQADAHRRDFLFFFCKPLSTAVLARVVTTLATQAAAPRAAA